MADISGKDANPAPSELLHYSDAHKVLICKPCQYAIQPGALPRHLKEIHGIYRGARRPYTIYVSGMQLRGPDHVVQPGPEQFPVPYLRLEQGLRCTAPDCDHMCTSLKRMSVHWSTTHGRSGQPDRDWVPAQLQTFFRGNKLRYFSGLTGSRQALLPTGLPPMCDGEGADQLFQGIRDAYKLNRLDTCILEHYFHSTYQHFIFEGSAAPAQDRNVWLHAVPRIVFDHPFVLHEILACTAMHMALSGRESERTALTLQAMGHHQTAIPLFRKAVVAPTPENGHAIFTFAYLLTILTLAFDVDNAADQLLLVSSPESAWSNTDLLLPPWLHTIRYGCHMLRSVWEYIVEGPISSLATAWIKYHDLDRLIAESGTAEPYYQFFLSVIPEEGTAESWQPSAVSAYQSAAQSLAVAYATMISKDLRPSMITVWRIIAIWPTRVNQEYLGLLSAKHPGALILLAYYCVILNQLDGMWYFRGRPKRLLASIMDNLDEKWHVHLQDAIAQVM